MVQITKCYDIGQRKRENLLVRVRLTRRMTTAEQREDAHENTRRSRNKMDGDGREM